MTHSLHRYNRNEENLEKDFVIMAMPSKGLTDKGAGPKIKEILSIHKKNLDTPSDKSHRCVNMGGMKVGNIENSSPEEIISRCRDYASTFNGVYTDPEVVKDVISRLIKEDLGISIVITGPYEETSRICHELGIRPHSVNFSLGIWGKKELLPEPEILEITTMCGHAMISSNLVKEYFKKVKKGYDPEKAAKKLLYRCYCAIFNPKKAIEIMRKERGGVNKM